MDIDAMQVQLRQLLAFKERYEPLLVELAGMRDAYLDAHKIVETEGADSNGASGPVDGQDTPDAGSQDAGDSEGASLTSETELQEPPVAVEPVKTSETDAPEPDAPIERTVSEIVPEASAVASETVEQEPALVSAENTEVTTQPEKLPVPLVEPAA